MRDFVRGHAVLPRGELAGELAEVDQALVPAENVVGVVQFHIPYFGYLVQFVNTANGTLLFVVVPAVLLVVNELWNFRTALTDDGDSDTATEND
ncbi:hypothetical protein [Salarchaeum sp. JOR-1]|uniref:hypothetical protein n=1 Tax=Salarchaeum sp. JOR-1 TaxID=2599399 RepID=UPI00143D19A1|nr:hypothetical protein [Salarchaeum sp. JOR-1]